MGNGVPVPSPSPLQPLLVLLLYLRTSRGTRPRLYSLTRESGDLIESVAFTIPIPATAGPLTIALSRSLSIVSHHDRFARVTQAHQGGTSLVFRQSRLWVLSGDEPTEDAYLLLRWMANRPVGETGYQKIRETNSADGRLYSRRGPPYLGHRRPEANVRQAV